jgi:hypothetical protein
LVPADSVGLLAHDSRVDYSQQADPSDQHCSPDAQPARWLAAELPRALAGYKARQFVSRAQPRGR